MEHKADIWIERFGAYLRAERHYSEQTLSVYVPALEEFAAFFVEQANEELGKTVKGISPKAIAVMKKMPWTGNIRELRNVIRRCVLFAEGDYIEAEDLPVYVETPEHTLSSSDDFALRPGNEREQIEAALNKARGNKTVAAKLLQIDRKTLYNKMHQLGMDL